MIISKINTPNSPLSKFENINVLLFPFLVLFVFTPSQIFFFNHKYIDDDFSIVITFCVDWFFFFLLSLFFYYFIINKIIFVRIISSIGFIFFYCDVFSEVQLNSFDGRELKSEEGAIYSLIELFIFCAVVYLNYFFFKFRKFIFINIFFINIVSLIFLFLSLMKSFPSEVKVQKFIQIQTYPMYIIFILMVCKLITW